MRRADRLFRIVELVRGRRLSTAAWLAERLEVSERTIYRDVADLIAQGVPIEGEAGVGYRMGAGYELPPLMFSRAEAQALVAVVRMARDRIGSIQAQAAENALGKIMSVLPPAERAAAERLQLYAPTYGFDDMTRHMLDSVMAATEMRRKLRLQYETEGGDGSERIVRPLGTLYWGRAWTLVAWCELRNDFRSFRIDRIQALDTLGETWRDEPEQTLQAYFRRERARMEACGEYEPALDPSSVPRAPRPAPAGGMARDIARDIARDTSSHTSTGHASSEDGGPQHRPQDSRPPDEDDPFGR
ncbi:helix-turn-helix transcriptional regulator [Uliginosibacterium sp. H1]|uniref:helix-turn-helix transcriptional regulator n=1 Tax=Uliginosibacterium sp. H1 TaxID=3114757 RepID=UPI002E195411|nr:YafY family protein [Uliginosibacterium sp. H1]